MASLKKKKKKKKGTPLHNKNTKNIKKTKVKKKVTKRKRLPKVINDEDISQFIHSNNPEQSEPLKKRSRAEPWDANKSAMYKSWPHWGDVFLKAYRQHRIQGIASDVVNVSYTTLGRYKRGCKEFRDACHEVYHEQTDTLERSALSRAIEGTDDVVLFEGLPVYITHPVTGKKTFLTRKKYETALTIFMLKGRRREIYYPENQNLGGTADDKAAAVRDSIKEILKIMTPKPKE